MTSREISNVLKALDSRCETFKAEVAACEEVLNFTGLEEDYREQLERNLDIAKKKLEGSENTYFAFAKQQW